jgi:hypothetical protein
VYPHGQQRQQVPNPVNRPKCYVVKRFFHLQSRPSLVCRGESTTKKSVGQIIAAVPTGSCCFLRTLQPGQKAQNWTIW